MKNNSGIKLVTHYPKNGGYMILLIIAFFVSCGTVKTGKVDNKIQPTVFLPVVAPAHEDKATSKETVTDTVTKVIKEKHSVQVPVVVPALSDIKEDIIDNTQTLTKLEELKQVIINQSGQISDLTKSLKDATAAQNRSNRKLDSVSQVSHSKDEKMAVMQANIKVAEQTSSNLIFVLRIIPLPIGIILILAGAYMYLLGYRKGEKSNSYIKF